MVCLHAYPQLLIILLATRGIAAQQVWEINHIRLKRAALAQSDSIRQPGLAQPMSKEGSVIAPASLATRGLIALILLAAMPGTAAAQATNLAQRLGYPKDAKLLVLHADDLAVAHSVDRASFRALESKAVSSASLMVPCPWLTEVATYFQRNPQTDLGLHLTLTSEWQTYRWRPVTPWNQVTSLLGRDGYLWSDDPSFSLHAKPEEVEREIRSQIQRAVAVGIRPTHLDSHMATLFLEPRYFSVLVKVAHEYRLPFLAVREMKRKNNMLSLLGPNDIVLDSQPRLQLKPPVSGQPDEAKRQYLDALRELKPGVHEIIVHLGHDDAELQAITVNHPDFGSAWRQRDFEIVSSPEFKHALSEYHIALITWRELGNVLR